MNWVFRHRPSAAMVVACCALVVAASGTAVAAGNLVAGDKFIKKNSLSGNRLRNHTVTGQQIKLSSLGKVRSAANADNAANATNATNAANASMLSGQSASAFEPASNTIRTGVVKATLGQTITLATFGPFTLTMKCVNNGGGQSTAEIDASSTENGSIFFDATGPANTAETLISLTNAGGFGTSGDQLSPLIAPSGKGYKTILLAGLNGLGADCFADGVIIAG